MLAVPPGPFPPLAPLPPLAAVGVTYGVLKLSSSTNAPAAKSVTIAGRFHMVVSPGLEREAFVVDLVVRNAQPAQAVEGAGHHSGRAADVDVAVVDIRDELAERTWIERIRWHLAGAAPADEVVDRGAAQTCQLVELALEDQFVGVAGPVYEGQVAARSGQLFQ